MTNLFKLLHRDRCDIYSFVPQQGSSGTVMAKIMIFEGLPCRLSFVHSAPALPSETVSSSEISAVLFAGSGVSVPEGCEIRVFRGGVSYLFSAVGISKIYGSHCEIPLCERRKPL